MFIVSQILLSQTNACETKNISTYAIALGLTTYAIVYVYMLFYNNEQMSAFNNYIFYIIGIDLFLSAFYSYYQSDNKKQQNSLHKKEENKQDSQQSQKINDDNDDEDEDSSEEEEEDDHNQEQLLQSFEEIIKI